MMLRWIRSLFPLSGWPVGAIVILSQIIASYLVNLLSYPALYRMYPFFRTHKWENGGKIYQDIFRVRAWKEYIPVAGTFDKKSIGRNGHPGPEYLTKYILESLRAELCHGYAFIFALMICLISGPSADIKIIIWSVLLNAPCIIIQRFNRPRFERVVKRKRPDGSAGMVRFWEGGERLRNPERR